MTKLLITCSAAIVLLAAAALLGAATAQGGGSAAACTTGPMTYHGVRAHRTCGPASAAVRMSGRTISYRGGKCERTASGLTLTMGISILGKDIKPLPRSFGLTVGRFFGVGKAARRDGTYRGATIAFVDRSRRFASLDSQVTLAGGRTRGSFTARVPGGPSFNGTFRCS